MLRNQTVEGQEYPEDQQRQWLFQDSDLGPCMVCQLNLRPLCGTTARRTCPVGLHPAYQKGATLFMRAVQRPTDLHCRCAREWRTFPWPTNGSLPLGVPQTTFNLRYSSLPVRPAASPITPKPNPAARSPLSSASRPALPPRTVTESPLDKGVARPGFSVPTSAAAAAVKQQSFQVQDATVPVPKLTTFSRPRSARTSKAGGNSGGSSPSLVGGGDTSKSVAYASTVAAGNRNIPSGTVDNSSTPPKLPSRASAAINSSSAPSATMTKAADPGPVRFSPVAIRSNNAAVAAAAAAAANNALPTISRNSQPLPLPSRPGVGSTNNSNNNNNNNTPSASLGLTRSATTGNNITLPTRENEVSSDKGSSSPFGIKLNSVNNARPFVDQTQGGPAHTPAAAASSTLGGGGATEKAPPLPARSNTIASSSSSSSTTASFSPIPSPVGRSPVSLRSLQENSRDSTLSAHQQLSPQDRERERMAKSVGNSTSTWVSGRSSPLQGSTVGSRVAMMPPAQIPDMTSSENVGIKRNARRRYEALFRASTTGEFIEGKE